MNTLESYELPKDIQKLIQDRSTRDVHEDDKLLIGESGYTPSDNSILYDAMIALALGKNVLLKGPTGSGKTKLAETLSNLFHQPMHSINCSVDLDAEALLGFKTIENNQSGTSIEFIPGPVVNAMKKGHLLYIDEINMAKPETLPILNGVLDYRRMITNPFTGEIVRSHEHFTVIAAINEGYVGTVPLNEALKNRFVVIDVPYIQGNELQVVLEKQSMLTDTTLIKTFTKLSADLLGLVQNGQISEEAASIRALIDTCDLASYLPPKRAIERGIVEKLEDEREKAAIRNVAETLFE